MKFISLLLALGLGFSAQASTVFEASIPLFVAPAKTVLNLSTPRGAAIVVDLYDGPSEKLLVLAPGQGCSSRLDLYDRLATEAVKSGYRLARLYWAYCVKDPATGQPADDLSTELQDLQTAITQLSATLNVPVSKITIGGKSLGTFVSQELFRLNKIYPTLVLLTPVCSHRDRAEDPTRNIMTENYLDLDKETREIFLIQGSSDPLCETPHLLEFLKGKPKNFHSLITNGNHGLGITDAAGNFLVPETEKNIEAICRWLFTWL